MSSTPIIKTRKRRVVPSLNRKKALFSCDRCKTRKTACQRDLESAVQPCLSCRKAGVECQTTILRKKKPQGPIENIGLHYKCLLMLVKGFCPEVDANNIDALIRFGSSKGIKMPSRYGDVDSENDELTELALKLTSAKGHLTPKTTPKLELPPLTFQPEFSLPLFLEPERMIVDMAGNYHYLGPMGAPSLLTSSLEIMANKININLNLWSSYKSVLKQERLISSEQDKIDFESLDLPLFPVVHILNRQEADHYVDVFFSTIHLRHLCFIESAFREKYDLFWVSQNKLNNHQVCCIYMVWVLGRLLREPPAHLNQFDEKLMLKHINIVKLCLSDILLKPTLDGIRCMMLLSTYMDNNKKRESGYILLEAAARQAVSMGLNKSTIVEHAKNEVEAEEMKRLWWSVFAHEVRISNHMGRCSCIQIEDITIAPPELPDMEEFPFYRECYIHSINLHKHMYNVLEYRKQLVQTQDRMSNNDLQNAVAIKNDFVAWLEQLPSCQNSYMLDLLMRCHYGIISLTFPFLLYACKHLDVSVKEIPEVADLITLCLHSAVEVSNLALKSNQLGVFNGTLFPDVFIAYHATMVLVVASILWLNKKFSEINLDEVKQALESIKLVNLENSQYFTGSLKKISRIIEMLLGGLSIIDDSKDLMGSPNVEFSEEFLTQINFMLGLPESHREHKNLLTSDYSLGDFDLLYPLFAFSDPDGELRRDDCFFDDRKSDFVGPQIF